MPLIDKTYFVGEINIPDTSTTSVEERLTFFIAKYEDQLLRSLLGHALYAAYTTGIAAETPDSKWTDLRDGKTYTDDDDNTQYWPGFRKASTKQSLIANYVYYWWTRDKVTHTSAVGETTPASDGGGNASPALKQMRAWNELADHVAELVRFLDYHIEDYPDWEQWSSATVLIDFAPINTFNI
jgi:hypothetical protein